MSELKMLKVKIYVNRDETFVDTEPLDNILPELFYGFWKGIDNVGNKIILKVFRGNYLEYIKFEDDKVIERNTYSFSTSGTTISFNDTVLDYKNAQLFNETITLDKINFSDDVLYANKNGTYESSDTNGFKEVHVEIPTQQKTVTPRVTPQTILPDDGYLISSINVNAADKNIDANIQSDNIKQGVTILGEIGTFTSDGDVQAEDIIAGKVAYSKGAKVVGSVVKETVEVEPKVTPQTILPSEGNLIEEVNVSAVTSKIDSNLTPTNIRKGVTILDVLGNLEPDKPDQNKTVTPNREEQIVVADNGFELAKVTVNPISNEYIEAEYMSDAGLFMKQLNLFLTDYEVAQLYSGNYKIKEETN